jgi:hypothetical protein
MVRLTDTFHRILSSIFFVVVVFFAANYYLPVGLLETRTAGRALMLTGLAFVLYLAFFARQHREMMKRGAEERAKKDR